MIRRPLTAGMFGAALLAATLTSAHAFENEVFALKNRWEHITTEMPANAREDALGQLADEADALADAHPDAAPVLTWQGIILASEARAKGGVGALGLAKQARAALERAIELDPQGQNGSAYVTLGALYDRAPGWPLGFGDSETAEQMFKRALEIRPQGIDVNYYYAAYLADEGRRDEAREYAQRAVAGEPRESRQTSDEALREEARAFLEGL
ncbi:TRAP transporter TatT component family protein [Litchfieldella xinjiangensis]|uniref:TRAP transporter TatT component family protein n=1 Tax=Litchfieldella xinjiangensis TaxID=1166948 RepID=UPI0005BDE1D0|nr:TRAP transporter TatT component family protein [Halomonas xinjiangensis]